jgi:hypothetical protein
MCGSMSGGRVMCHGSSELSLPALYLVLVTLRVSNAMPDIHGKYNTTIDNMFVAEFI